jgi:hypothetical protein
VFLHGPKNNNNERGTKTNQQTEGKYNQRKEDNNVPTFISQGGRGSSNHEASAGGLSEGAEEISAHTGHVTDVVTDIVSDHSRVSGIVFRNTMDDFADKVSAYISSFGVDTTTNSSEENNRGATKAISRDTVHHELIVIKGEVSSVDSKEQHEDENAQGAKGETHHTTSIEGHIEAVSPAWSHSLNGGSHIGEDSHSHANVATQDRGESSTSKGKEGKEAIHNGGFGPGNKDENDQSEDDHKIQADHVFGMKEGFGSLLNHGIDLV